MGCKGLHCPGCSPGGGGTKSGGGIALVVAVIVAAIIVARVGPAVRHGADEVGHVLTIAALVVVITLAVAVAGAALAAIGWAGWRLYCWRQAKALDRPLKLVRVESVRVDGQTSRRVPGSLSPSPPEHARASVARPPGRALTRPERSGARVRPWQAGHAWMEKAAGQQSHDDTTG